MLSSISIPQLLIILAIVILIFGSKRIKSLGEDMGEGLRGLRQGFKEVEGLDEDIKADIKDQRVRHHEEW